MREADSGTEGLRRPAYRGQPGAVGLLVLLGMALVACLFPSMAEAQATDPVGPDAEGAPFLLLPSGARAVGLGGAVTALSSPEAAFWNPAGLAGLSRGRILVTRGEHITGEALGVSLQYGWQRRAVLGATYQLLDEGTQDATDIDGNVIGSFTSRNHLAVMSVATTLASRLDLGANLKYLRFELGCRGQCPDGQVRSTSYAVDLGARGRPLSTVPVDLGISLLHMGPDFRNEDAQQQAPLPARIRAGVSWEPWSLMIEEERLAVLVLLDLEDRLRDPGDPAVLLGAEFSAGTEDRVYVRGGYTLVRGTGLEGAAAGLGLRFDRFELELARSLPRGAIASQQEPVHLTLALRF